MNEIYMLCICILFALMFIVGYFLGHYTGKRASSSEQKKLDELRELIQAVKKDIENREMTTMYSENNPF